MAGQGGPVPFSGRQDQPADRPDEATRIADFWAWWSASGAEEAAAAIADRDPQRVVDDLAGHVAAVDDGLAWEMAPGRTARHLLVVSPEGTPELRAVARRWLRGAPAADETWEYADARQPVAELDEVVLGVNGVELPLGQLAVETAPEGTRLAVTLHHPLLAALTEQERMSIGFLALDAAVGEAAVETWIGSIAVSVEPRPDAVPLARLRERLDAHRAEHLDDAGEPTWRILQGEGPDGPVLVSAMVPLCATVAAQLDRHLPVVVPYAGRTEQGFPDGSTLEALRRLEDHLTERLGTSGRLVAVETSAGRRTLHYYVDSTSPAPDVVRAAVTGWPDGAVEVGGGLDPGWQAVRPFG